MKEFAANDDYWMHYVFPADSNSETETDNKSIKFVHLLINTVTQGETKAWLVFVDNQVAELICAEEIVG